MPESETPETVSCYRVVSWDDHFETAKSREVKRLDRAYVPNKFDDDGYNELLLAAGDDPWRAAGYLGAWTTILQVASRCNRHSGDRKKDGPYRDGTLMRGSGRPHTTRSLAMMSRLPEAVYVEVLPILVSLGWLEDTQVPMPRIPCGYPGIRGTDTQIPTVGKGRVGKRRVEKGREEDAAEAPGTPADTRVPATAPPSPAGSPAAPGSPKPSPLVRLSDKSPKPGPKDVLAAFDAIRLRVSGQPYSKAQRAGEAKAAAAQLKTVEAQGAQWSRFVRVFEQAHRDPFYADKGLMAILGAFDELERKVRDPTPNGRRRGGRTALDVLAEDAACDPNSKHFQGAS